MIELSVILPISKIDNFLEESILSISNQSFRNFKIFIVLPLEIENDVRAFISNFEQLHDIEIIFLIQKVMGISFALNLAINNCDTEYIARMDADDISSQQRFEKQISYLKSNPDVGIVGSKIYLINNFGHKYENWIFKFYENDEQIRSALRYRMPLCHPALMFRTNVLLELKGYLYGCTAEDHELFLRMRRCTNYKFHNLPDIPFFYRRHDMQSTTPQRAMIAYKDISAFLFREFLYTYDIVFLIGIFSNHPFFRKLRRLRRKLIAFSI